MIIWAGRGRPKAAQVQANVDRGFDLLRVQGGPRESWARGLGKEQGKREGPQPGPQRERSPVPVYTARAMAMAAVTTPPHVFSSGCRMLLKMGTLLTWHCRGAGHSYGGEVASSPVSRERGLGDKGHRGKRQVLGSPFHPSSQDPHPACNVGSIPGWGVG